jgi:hypothetical protein
MPEFLTLADVLTNMLEQIGVLLGLPDDLRILVKQIADLSAEFSIVWVARP